MAKDYIPEPDSLAAYWMRGFSKNLGENPSKYALTSPIAGQIESAVVSFRDALAVALRPSTRTKVTVAIKKKARRSAEKICRRYAQQIRNNDDISESDKIAIGVRPIKRKRVKKINVPMELPWLKFTKATVGQHHLSVGGDTAGKRHSKRKPAGAIGLQVYVQITDGSPEDRPSLDKSQYWGTYTRTPFVIDGYKPSDAGKLATVRARWISRRGEEGPFSMPVSMRIVA